MAGSHCLADSLACTGRRSLALSCIAIVLGGFGAAAHAQVCGNGVLETGEQCDDGNRASFDGCSANCRFEQSQRINQLSIDSTTPAACTGNVLGSHALTGTVLPGLNTSLAGGVADGTTSLLLYFAHGLQDPTGAGTQSSLQIGVLNGTPLPGSGYDGTNDVDWWYATDDTEIGAGQVPRSLLSGAISSGALSAGPGSFAIALVFGGVYGQWHISGGTFASPIDTSSTPMTNSPGTVRGHLASENLDPTLQSFTASGSGSPAAGVLCGNVSAASLAAMPVPLTLRSGGSTACTQGYDPSPSVTNSFLDVLVSGCKVEGGLITVINVTQPDTTDPSAVPAGSGAPYKLIPDANHIVTTCQDSNKTTVDLATCLNAAAYSVAFAFSTDRVIAKSSAAQDVVFHDDFDFFP